jgi:hypothetical protein
MKRALFLSLAIALALVVSELVVAHCVGYPSYGVAYKVAYRVGGSTWTNIRKPHSKIFNVEGKTLTKVNNVGLPGVELSSLEHPIVVLGSSYIEAFQYLPDQIASSKFQASLDNRGSKRQVINLGCSGHDPYDSWFRIKYFEDKLGFRTDDVILVLDSDNEDWFRRHPQPFAFGKPPWFGRKNTSGPIRIGIAVRNASSLFEVLYKGFIKGDDVDDTPSPIHMTSGEDHSEAVAYSLSQEMKDCLVAFSDEYPGFRVLSIAGDAEFNSTLVKFSEEKSIPVHVTPLGKTIYKIGGAGHLNKAGNEALAEALMIFWESTNNTL